MRQHTMLERAKEYKDQLDVYFEDRKARNMGVPQSKKIGVPSHAYISLETGIPLSVLRRKLIARHIEQWIGQIGFSELLQLPASSRRGRNIEKGNIYERKVDDYLKQLIQAGNKVPEHPINRGEPHLSRIANECGVTADSLSSGKVARRRLDEGITELGLEMYADGPRWDVISYNQLFIEGASQRKNELEGRSRASQQLSNTKYALRLLMKHVEREPGKTLSMEDPVGPELHVQFEETVRQITGKIKSIKSRRKFATEIIHWRDYFQGLKKSLGLPSGFRSALDAAIKRSGLSVKWIGEQAEGDPRKIEFWRSGRQCPSILSFTFIENIEKVLGLPPKCLISQIKIKTSRRFSPSDFPEFCTLNGERVPLSSNGRLLHRVRRLVPDTFAQQPMAAREEIITWLMVNLIGPTTEWGVVNRFLIGTPYMMMEFNPVLEEEYNELKVFKCDRTSPPPPMKRNGIWSKAGESIFRRELGYLLGALALPENADDLRLRGLGLDSSSFCLAMFTCPKILHSWVRWKGIRRVNVQNKELKRKGCREEHEVAFSFQEVRTINSWISLLKPETGWLRQRPDIAFHLKPIPGFIDDAFIERSKKEWNVVCDEASSYYKNLAKEIEDIAEQLRDPFEPILSILESSSPIAALRLFARNIFEDMPDPATAPLQAARHMRNYVMVRLFSATALRSRNIRELTYLEDNTGELRREAGKWVIVIHHMRFKNWQSSFFGPKRKKSSYRKILLDVDDLYRCLDEYVEVYRPMLLRDRKSDILLVSNTLNTMFSGCALHNNYRRLTLLYLAYNPYLNRGIPGVKPHGPHAVRDIFATHVIKSTGSYEMAAYVIQDSVNTVREHYARFMPKDKIHLVDEIINKSWNEE